VPDGRRRRRACRGGSLPTGEASTGARPPHASPPSRPPAPPRRGRPSGGKRRAPPPARTPAVGGRFRRAVAGAELVDGGTGSRLPSCDHGAWRKVGGGTGGGTRPPEGSPGPPGPTAVAPRRPQSRVDPVPGGAGSKSGHTGSAPAGTGRRHSGGRRREGGGARRRGGQAEMSRRRLPRGGGPFSLGPPLRRRREGGASDGVTAAAGGRGGVFLINFSSPRIFRREYFVLCGCSSDFVMV
jgi:hypothetical protein